VVFESCSIGSARSSSGLGPSSVGSGSSSIHLAPRSFGSRDLVVRVEPELVRPEPKLDRIGPQRVRPELQRVRPQRKLGWISPCARTRRAKARPTFSRARATGPRVHRTKPRAHHDRPPARHTCPSARHTCPSAHRTCPSAHRTCPSARRTCPSAHRTRARARHTGSRSRDARTSGHRHPGSDSPAQRIASKTSVPSPTRRPPSACDPSFAGSTDDNPVSNSRVRPPSAHKDEVVSGAPPPCNLDDAAVRHLTPTALELADGADARARLLCRWTLSRDSRER